MSKTLVEVMPELRAIAEEMGIKVNNYKVVQEYQRRRPEELRKITMKKKYKKAKAINILVCIGIVIVIMLYAYNAWSLNGDYTLFSFFASLVVYGGWGVLIYFVVDCALRRAFNQKPL